MAIFTLMSTLMGGTLAHMRGISDLEITLVNGQARLYVGAFADGGLTVFDLAGGQVASLVDQVGYGPSRGTLGLSAIELVQINGTQYLLPSGRYDDKMALHKIGADGAFASIKTFDNSPSEIGGILATETLVVGGKTIIITSQFGSSGLSSFRLGDDLNLNLRATIADTTGSYIGDVTALASVQLGAKSYLFATSAFDAGVSSFLVKGTGKLKLKDGFGAGDGPGFAAPDVLEVAQSGARSFLLLGAAGTGTITVFQIKNSGKLKLADHRQDTLDSRFDGVSAIESFSYNGRSFILAGGSDDGISLFELTPNGRLFLLASLADQLDSSLTNVTAIETFVNGSEIQVFVAGEGEGGISQFSLDLEGVGSTLQGGGRADILTGGSGNDLLVGGGGRDALNGGAGNDRLLDGKGKDVLTGGAGVDIFVFDQDGKTDTITDFSPGVDQIDMSNYAMLYQFSGLDIRERSWGFAVKFAGETLKVYLEDTAPQNQSSLDISADDFIF